MAYVSVSRWKLGESFDDAALTQAAEMYASELKESGADNAMMVRMSATDGLFICNYPDAETRSAARDKELAMQQERMAELPVELVEEMEGPALTNG